MSNTGAPACRGRTQLPLKQEAPNRGWSGQRNIGSINELLDARYRVAQAGAGGTIYIGRTYRGYFYTGSRCLNSQIDRAEEGIAIIHVDNGGSSREGAENGGRAVAVYHEVYRISISRYVGVIKIYTEYVSGLGPKGA
jgi:hypothetical protein